MHKKPNQISVFEYESITYKLKRHYKEGFTEEIHQAFLNFHDNNPNTPFFDLIHHGV